MKLIRTTRLLRHQRQMLHCEIALYQVDSAPGTRPNGESAHYLVTLRQGRSGAAWRSSTLTAQAVPIGRADAVFAQALDARRAQGFSEEDASAITVPAPPAGMPPAGTVDAGASDALLLARLQPASWLHLSAAQRSRTLWRIGERRLASAVPRLVELLGQDSPMHDYCAAWAIGRCGDGGAALAMQALHAGGASEMVRRMALLAWLQLIDQARLRQHAAALVADWPASLRNAWAGQDEQAVAAVLADRAAWQALSLSDWLEQLDQVALSDAFARRVLLAQLRALPLRAGVFRAVRHLYKAAEMRGDAVVFGLLQQRFDTSPASVASGGWIRVERAYVRFAEEAARPDSRVAYGPLTRDYLRRRGWRTLRRLGLEGDPAYVTLAAGVLHAMDDADAGQPYSRAGGARRYGPYSHWMLFNRLLHAPASSAWRPNRSGRSWHLPPAAAADSTARQEAFPALWDARPDALLELMLTSRCAGVHAFAARALSENAAYGALIPDVLLHRLLCGPYRDSARFAFSLSLARMEATQPATAWLLLFLQSGLPEARQHVLDCISRAPDRYGADAVLVTALLSAAAGELRRQGRMLCQIALAQPGQAEAIVLQLLDWLRHCPDLDDIDTLLPLLTPDLLWLLDHPLRAAAAQAPYALLLDLLDDPLPALRAIAGAWLLRHAMPLSALPAATLAALLGAADPAVRRIGAALFCALPDPMLSAQPQLFAVLCNDADPAVRRLLDAALARLAPGHPAWRAALLPALLDGLFRGETADGVHADLLRWLQGPLLPALATLGRDTVLRLLSARSKGAQQLGAWLLPRFAANGFEVGEWAALARNENAAVRRWACQAFSGDPGRARADMEQALRLFDSRWEDSRAFACAFFEQQCQAGDWTPALLLSLCDHLDPAVQRFGRTMLVTHFEVGDATESMLKLSQHPSASMQSFVGDWLERSAAGDLATLHRLEPYFLSVLSQVNRGRLVKQRVLAFLRRQAGVSQADAAFVARLFTRQVLTVAIADKAHYIEGLRAIQACYPGLAPTLTIASPPRRAARGEAA